MSAKAKSLFRFPYVKWERFGGASVIYVQTPGLVLILPYPTSVISTMTTTKCITLYILRVLLLRGFNFAFPIFFLYMCMA